MAIRPHVLRADPRDHTFRFEEVADEDEEDMVEPEIHTPETGR